MIEAWISSGRVANQLRIAPGRVDAWVGQGAIRCLDRNGERYLALGDLDRLVESCRIAPGTISELWRG